MKVEMTYCFYCNASRMCILLREIDKLKTYRCTDCKRIFIKDEKNVPHR